MKSEEINPESPRVLEDLSEEECYLYAILNDLSGIDQAEFLMRDSSTEDGLWRAWAFQYKWFRDESPLQVSACARSVGKSLSILIRACAFPILFPGQEMVITAPQLIHLERIAKLVENHIIDNRLTRDLLPRKPKYGITHRPLEIDFVNGSRILGRIPQDDGVGMKGIHPLWLELDEGQNFAHDGWVEVRETLLHGVEGAQWRAHGVSRGLRDDFYEISQEAPDNPWTVHHFEAMWRPTWSDDERQKKIQQYGSRNDPNYKRNVLGDHGDEQNAIFVTANLLRCFWEKTEVEVLERGQKIVKYLQDVRVGDIVTNALGSGVVRKVIPSRHRKILRLKVGADVLYCTPDHPILTATGWEQAQFLRPGIHLLTGESLCSLSEGIDGESAEILLKEVLHRRTLGASEDAACCNSEANMRNLREGIGYRSAKEVLLKEVLGQVHHPASQNLSGVQTRIQGKRSQDLLLSGLRCATKGSEQSEERRQLSLLWDLTLGQTTCPPVLQSGMLESMADPQARSSALSGVWPTVFGSLYTEILFSYLFREATKSTRQAASGENLCSLWGDFLQGRQKGEVLLSGMCTPGSKATFSTSSYLWSLSEDVPSSECSTSVLFDRVLEDQKAGLALQTEAESAVITRRNWRDVSSAIHSLGSPGGQRRWMGTRVLHESLWGSGGYGADFSGSSSSCTEDQCGMRRPLSSVVSGHAEGSAPRRMADFPRVESVEILESGDPEFARLSGGKDYVECYDLTVSGHPSFAVGKSGIIVHNCADSNETSEYNASEYFLREIKVETLEHYDRSMESLLDFPPSHKKYLGTNKRKPAGVFWVGMDLGLTIDPSEILVFVEYTPKVNQPSHLKLLTRINMVRVGYQLQLDAIMAVINFYRPRAFCMDKGGLGQPIVTDLQERAVRDPETYKYALNVIKGYSFAQKILVEVDSTVELGPYDDPAKMAGVYRNVKEYGIDLLRGLVDDRRIELPWDTHLLKEWQGGTWTSSKKITDQYGSRRFSKGEDHTLDAATFAVVGWDQHRIEEFVEDKKDREPVLDFFVSL